MGGGCRRYGRGGPPFSAFSVQGVTAIPAPGGPSVPKALVGGSIHPSGPPDPGWNGDGGVWRASQVCFLLG